MTPHPAPHTTCKRRPRRPHRAWPLHALHAVVLSSSKNKKNTSARTLPSRPGMRAASTPHLLDAFMADVCQHVTLYGWWFSPVAACSLAATCKHLRRHLEPREWSCTTRGCARTLFERTLQRAQLTQLSLLRKHAQEVVERNYDRVLRAQLATAEGADWQGYAAGTIVAIGQTLEQMRDRRRAYATRDAFPLALLSGPDAPAVRSVFPASPGQWALVYFDWLRDFFGCEVGPHPKTAEPRRNVRQVDHSDALLAFASLLVALRKPWASGHGRFVCHQMERAVQELVRVRMRRLQTAGAGA